jgi:hypothetical protein
MTTRSGGCLHPAFSGVPPAPCFLWGVLCGRAGVRRRLFQLLLESFFTPPRPGWKSLLSTRKNHAIKSTCPIPTRVATIVDEEFAVVPKSPTKRSALARIPTDAITFQKTLLRSMTNEITAPAPITPLRPASLVTIKSAIPRTGLLAAIMDQILLVCLRAT